MPVDLYSLVHKGQRYHLFQLAQELSHADLTQPATQKWATHHIEALVALLVDHAHNEERYIHPLFANVGSTAAQLETEHAELEAQLNSLLVALTERRFDELYSAVMRLIGVYLLHLDAEETAQRDVLWQHYDDAKLLAVMARFKSERDPVAAMADLKLLLPAMNMPELVAFVNNLRAQIPSAQFAGLVPLLETALGDARWSELQLLL